MWQPQDRPTNLRRSVGRYNVANLIPSMHRFMHFFVDATRLRYDSLETVLRHPHDWLTILQELALFEGGAAFNYYLPH